MFFPVCPYVIEISGIHNLIVQNFSRINEIQRNFKKIQRDIESKKSELRTMVGERYRELINTADTIAEMENTVKDIRTTLDSIQTSCKLGTVSCRISPKMYLKWQPFKDLTYYKTTNSPPKFLNQNSM